MAFRKQGGFGGGQHGGFRPGGRPSFGGGRGHGGGFGGAREERGGERFTAVCADCGNTCDVPFRPNGKKPVYCKECLAKHHSDTRGGDRDFAPRPQRSFERRESFGAPAPRAAAPDHRIDTLVREVSMLGTKLDALAQALHKLATPAAAAAPSTKTPEATKAPAAKKVAKKAAKKTKK